MEQVKLQQMFSSRACTGIVPALIRLAAAQLRRTVPIHYVVAVRRFKDRNLIVMPCNVPCFREGGSTRRMHRRRFLCHSYTVSARMIRLYKTVSIIHIFSREGAAEVEPPCQLQILSSSTLLPPPPASFHPHPFQRSPLKVFQTAKEVPGRCCSSILLQPIIFLEFPHRYADL